MSEITTLNGYEIADEKARNTLNTLTNDRYIFIGDSYGTGNTADENGNPVKITTSWIELAISYLGLTAGNHYTKAQNGSGFAYPTNATFTHLIQQLEGTVESPETITKIVCCGGFNDMKNLGEIQSGISSFMSYVKEQYPNAKVYVGFIAWSKNALNWANLMTTCKTYQESASRYGASYVGGLEYVLHDYNNIYTDTIHPTQNGQNLIASRLCSFLNGGNSNTYVAMGTASCSLLGTPVNNGSCASFLTGDMASFVSMDILETDMQVGFTTGLTPWVKIGNVTSSYVWGASWRSLATPTPILIDDVEYSGYVTISQGELLFRIINKESIATDVHNIKIPNFSYCFPTWLC